VIFLALAPQAGSAQDAHALENGRSGKAGAPLVGAWRLVAIQNVRADGTIDVTREGLAKWMGSRPVGLLVYEASGWMSVQIGRDPRVEWKAGTIQDATAADKTMAFEAFYSYFGRYEVDEQAGTVVHHVERSLWPVESGKSLRRFFRVQGGRLTLTTAPLPDGSHNSLTWERVGAS
jgi:hypothetical protein